MTTLDTSYYKPADCREVEGIQRTLSIQQGRKSKMYTLWICVNNGMFAKDSFIKNLSVDKEKAWEKAIKHADRVKCELHDDSEDQLRKIIRQSDVEKGIINFGKNEGKHVSELEDGYLLWVCQGAKIEKETMRTNFRSEPTGVFYKEEIQLACNTLVNLAIEEAVIRGLYREHEGKMMPVRLIEVIEKSKEGFGHYYTEKDKVELVLTVLKIVSFETAYGYTFIYTFVDETGRKFLYKGTRQNLEKDEMYTIKGTVKHGEYRDQKQTFLQRIKIEKK